MVRAELPGFEAIRREENHGDCLGFWVRDTADAAILVEQVVHMSQTLGRLKALRIEGVISSDACPNGTSSDCKTFLVSTEHRRATGASKRRLLTGGLWDQAA